MLGVVVNTVAIIIGSILGKIFKEGIGENITNAVMNVMGLAMILIGLQSALETDEMLCLIICIVVGTIIGEVIKLDDALNKAGDFAKAKFNEKGGENNDFTEGFVTATLLFCIGSMAIVGSLQAGTNHNYSILYAKSVMDFVSAIMLSSIFGIGVACSSIFVFLTEGVMTILSASLSTVLTPAIITEISAVGGIILLGMALNILILDKNGEPIKSANMIPAIILPPIYLAITSMF